MLSVHLVGVLEPPALCMYVIYSPFFGMPSTLQTRSITNRFVGPSTLRTCRIIHRFRWSCPLSGVNISNFNYGDPFALRLIPSKLWTCIIITVLVIRPLYGHVELLNVLGDPSTLWTCGIIKRFGWSVHFMDVELFTVLGDPSTLWTCRIIHRFRWSVHFVESTPSNLWTCITITVLVIRPLCGGYTVQFVDM